VVLQAPASDPRDFGGQPRGDGSVPG